jgi:hypothetical protein
MHFRLACSAAPLRSRYCTARVSKRSLNIKVENAVKESILSIKPGPFDTSVENQGLLAKRKDFCLEFQSRLDRKNRKIVE